MTCPCRDIECVAFDICCEEESKKAERELRTAIRQRGERYIVGYYSNGSGAIPIYEQRKGYKNEKI